MTKKSIKIIIGGRNYPLTINEEEEEFIKQAADDINTGIQRLQESYAVKDMQDLLAMTSLQLATRRAKKPSNQGEGMLPKEEVMVELKKLAESIEE